MDCAPLFREHNFFCDTIPFRSGSTDATHDYQMRATGITR